MNNSSFYNSHLENPEEVFDEVLLEDNEKKLVLFNDEENTFDFIINALIDICDHSPEQAEQCAMIAHLKGKCVVKEGPGELIKKMAKELTSMQIIVEIN